MKNKKIISILLTLTISMAGLSLAGCSNDDGKGDNDETEATVIQEEETEATAEETEATEQSGSNQNQEALFVMPDLNDLSNSGNPDNVNDAQAYEAFTAFVEEYSSDHPDAKYSYIMYYFNGNQYLSEWGLAVTEGNHTVFYGVDDTGSVVMGDEEDDSFQAGRFTSDDILQFPLMLELYGYAKNGITYSVEDGTYFGSLYAVNYDGTMALVVVGNPIIIDASTYDSLAGAASFTDINGEEYTIAEEGDYGNDYISIDEEGESLYGWFIDAGDGLYIMESESDYIVHHHDRLVFLDIASDCEITDCYAPLVSSTNGAPTADSDTGLNPNEPLTISNSYFLYNYITNDYSNFYNNWVEAYAILEPVTIENGVVTEITLGWR